MIWLQSSIFKLAIFIVPPLLVIMASEHLKPIGEELAQKQIDQLEQDKWPQTEAHGQSPLLGMSPISASPATLPTAPIVSRGDT